MDFKNGLPGADSKFFYKVSIHQSFFFDSLTNEKEVSNEKIVTMHEQHHNFRVFHLLQTCQSLSVLSLRLALFRIFI